MSINHYKIGEKYDKRRKLSSDQYKEIIDLCNSVVLPSENGR